MNYMVFDFGGTAVKYAVMDEHSTILEKGSYPLNQLSQTNFELFLQALLTQYSSLKEKYDFTGIAISSPGFVDSEKGIVHGFSAIPCIHEFPIAQAISKALDSLPVAMANDGNCSAYGEYYIGLKQAYKNVVKIVCGSGIGGGYVQNGIIHPTAHMASSEFGFMPLVQEGDKVLSWSTYSVVGTAVHYNYEQNAALEAIELFDLAESQALEKSYTDKFYHYLAMGCLIISLALDPDIILIGGAISTRDSFSDNLNQALANLEKDEALTKYSNSLIQVSKLGNDGNLYGALYNFIHIGTCKQ
jgi:Transcriptional regulator/sugar kinase